MALTFKQTDTNASCSLSGKALTISGAAGSTAVSYSIPGGNGGLTFTWDQEAGVTWDAGNLTVRLNVTTANMNMEWISTSVRRVDSGCNLVETFGSDSTVTSLDTTGVKSVTFATTAVTPASTDDLQIQLTIRNNAMTGQAFSYTPNQNIDSPFTAEPSTIFNPIFARRQYNIRS